MPMKKAVKSAADCIGTIGIVDAAFATHLATTHQYYIGSSEVRKLLFVRMDVPAKLGILVALVITQFIPVYRLQKIYNRMYAHIVGLLTNILEYGILQINVD